MPRHPRRPSGVAVVLLAGLAVRAILVPITHGQDFEVWDLASRATLDGVNVYAHHPAYPGGPYSYLPLFLLVEVPMQWLALHSGVPFGVLGKLPIVAADLACGALLAGHVRRQRGGETAAALAAALFVLNPLVLYNSAFYGRFDSVGLALLLLALRAHQRGGFDGRFGWLYWLAVAAKTFPVFILPALLRRGRATATRLLVTGAVVVGGLAVPFMVGSPRAFVGDLLYNGDKLAGSLSWQILLRGLLSTHLQLVVADALLAGFAIAVLVLVDATDLVACCAVVLCLFLVCSKVLIEQYLTWPMPFLALLVVERGSRRAALLLGVLTAVGMAVNPYWHPFGREPGLIDAGLALTILACLPRLAAGHQGMGDNDGARAPGTGRRLEE